MTVSNQLFFRGMVVKKTLLATAVLLASSVSQAEWTSPDESLTIGGDAEINFDVVKNHKGAGITGPDETNTQTELNDDSRIKMMVMWNTTCSTGNFLMAKIEPLIRTNATVGVDDAYFMFGTEGMWEFQIGRYEAMNLFPLGKDVVLDYANGSDGLGSGIYYYMAKEGRGRAGQAGQARIAAKADNWSAEISTIYGKTSEVLESTQNYIDQSIFDEIPELKSDNNSFMIRPAINFMSETGGLSLSFGGEFEVNDDSVTLTATNETLNLSDRYGLAATATFMSDAMIWNTSVAYQHAKHYMKAYTVNTNITLGAFGIGASYANNDFVNKKGPTFDKANSYAVYTAYTLPIFDFDEATVTFALSYSDTKNGFGIKDNNEETTAFRIRFNYYF